MAATHQLQFLIIHILFLETMFTCFAAVSTPQELLKGFAAVPLHSSATSFQAILSDPTGNFSMGFLRLNQTQLALAILHVPSSEPFWLANPTHSASWTHTTRLFFNGSLVISDPGTGLLWSTSTNGDRVVLLNNSNLQVQKGSHSHALWGSFQFPTNTLVQDQNFTASMSLVSLNGLYSLRLDNDFMGLYANYGEEEGLLKQLYWKRTPLEAKAEIEEGQGPIYARVNTAGYLGMYQTSTKPVDVQKFNSFQRPFTFTSFLMVRVEPDGNLKGYYWDGSNWVLDYQAISETCGLPNPCGSYGLCTPGGSGCSCLDNRTRFQSGGCLGAGGGGDLCGEGIAGNNYWVLRRTGVQPPQKELLGYKRTSSLVACEGFCENNCSCWGALYNNATGYCYIMDYPIHTMLGTGDESKLGYFKVRKGAGKRNRVRVGVGVATAVLVGIVIIIGVGSWVRRKTKREGVNWIRKEENGVSSGPYENLGSASFRSIEMSKSKWPMRMAE